MSKPSSWLLAPGLAATLVTALVAGAPSGAGPARAASFDCAKAATPTEWAICRNPTLSALDGRLGAVYDQRVALDPGLRQIQRGWLAARNAGCGADPVCLGNMIRAELAWFASGETRPPDSLPIRPGVCGLSSISNVGTRLDGMPGSGSAVSEEDQADQVSYDTIPAIDRSRRGDPALVCLVSLPTNCPAGDDRGKIYAVANLRTLGAWSAPDSEHSCGGA
jgi:uncharacterized protein